MAIFAGPCLYYDFSETRMVQHTAKALVGIADFYRCKLWGGGTQIDRYYSGVGDIGINVLQQINENIIPVGCEIFTKEHIELVKDLYYFWFGARNSQNYRLIEALRHVTGMVLFKRDFGMTVDETIGLYDIYTNHAACTDEVFFVERGINTFDRLEYSRWSPDLKGVIRIKNERPDIFDKLIVDCSHSVGYKDFIGDTYRAFKAIGVQHFMFECTIDGKSKTDQFQMLSVDELEEILK